MPWQPGVSGNPNGRAPEIAEVREVRRLAQAKTKDAYQTIEHLMQNAEKDSVRLAAALAILKIAGMKMDGDVTVYVNQANGIQPKRPPTVEELEAKAGGPSLPLN